MTDDTMSMIELSSPTHSQSPTGSADIEDDAPLLSHSTQQRGSHADLSPPSPSKPIAAHHILLSPASSSPASSSSSSSLSPPSWSGNIIGSVARRWRMIDRGLRVGCMFLLLLWVVWDIILVSRLRPNSSAEAKLWTSLVLPVYRALLALLLLGWGTVGSMWIWQRYRINYMQLMELDAYGSRGNGSSGTINTVNTSSSRINMVTPGGLVASLSEVIDELVMSSIIYLLNFLIYFNMLRASIPRLVPSSFLPILLVAYFIYRILPWRWWIFGQRSKMLPVLRGFVAVAFAPYGVCNFYTCYLGDLWTSMVRPSIDLIYTICFVLTPTLWMNEVEEVARRQMEMQRMDGGGGASSSSDLHISTYFQSFFFRRLLIPFLSALPLWLRFMQCLARYMSTRKRFPHIANAFKYAIGFCVVLFGVLNAAAFQKAASNVRHGSVASATSDSASVASLRSAWIFFMILSSLYSFWWDVQQDWGLGLFDLPSPTHLPLFRRFSTSSSAASSGSSSLHKVLSQNTGPGRLREDRLFPSRSSYFIVVFIDLFLRFAWTLTLLPQGQDSPFHPDFILFLQPLLASGEIFRRSMWGCFRLEWEQIATQQSAYHRVPDSGSSSSVSSASSSSSSPSSSSSSSSLSMVGYRVLIEVSLLVVLVLGIGATMAFTAKQEET